MLSKIESGLLPFHVLLVVYELDNYCKVVGKGHREKVNAMVADSNQLRLYWSKINAKLMKGKIHFVSLLEYIKLIINNTKI